MRFPYAHGSLLAAFYKCDEEAGGNALCDGSIGEQARHCDRADFGVMTDAWVPETNDQTIEDVVFGLHRYGEPGKMIEPRLWDGRKIEPPPIRDGFR